jgi:hypothetical protein
MGGKLPLLFFVFSGLCCYVAAFGMCVCICSLVNLWNELNSASIVALSYVNVFVMSLHWLCIRLFFCSWQVLAIWFPLHPFQSCPVLKPNVSSANRAYIKRGSRSMCTCSCFCCYVAAFGKCVHMFVGECVDWAEFSISCCLVLRANVFCDDFVLVVYSSFFLFVASPRYLVPPSSIRVLSCA